MSRALSANGRIAGSSPTALAGQCSAVRACVCMCALINRAICLFDYVVFSKEIYAHLLGAARKLFVVSLFLSSDVWARGWSTLQQDREARFEKLGVPLDCPPTSEF